MKKYSKYIIIILSIIAFVITVCFIPISVSKLIPTVESQVYEELGIKVHIDKLVLRIGPAVKLKTPIMHLMYEDGQKFAQLDGVKFYISWPSLLSKKPKIMSLYSKNLVLRLNSEDNYLKEINKRLKEKNFSDLPSINLKKYSIQYASKNENNNYLLQGQTLEIAKVINYDNLKLKTNGNLLINNKKHLSYDIAIVPKYDLESKELKIDIENLLHQIKEFDFNSDLIADIKLYKESSANIQASGFVNIDNISILEKDNKTPKSFIYLTFLGDKASILSNIFTSPAKKIYIDGMVKNSQKPVIDIKVKAEDIDLKDLYAKLKIFSSFSNFKYIDSITGKADANFNLKGDLNKIKSNGYLKVAKAAISANGIKVNDINSNIDFSNNIIKITDCTAKVNNAPIVAKGEIGKEINVSILMDKVELKDICPAQFGVKKGVLSLVLDLSGKLDNILHKENVKIDNFIAKTLYEKLSIDTIRYDSNKSNIATILNIIYENKYTEQIKIPSMKINIDENNLNMQETNVFMANSMLQAKGEIINYNKPNVSFNSAFNGYINSKDIKNTKLPANRYPVKLAYYGNSAIQNLYAQLLLEKTITFDEPTLVNLNAKLDKNSIKIEDLSLTNHSGSLKNDFKSNMQGAKKITVTGILENFEAPILKNVRIFIPQALNIKAFGTIAQIKGDIFLNGFYNAPDIVGQLNITNLYNQQFESGTNNATIDFNKNNININAPLVKFADSSLGLTALASTDLKNGLIIKNINIKSKYLNTDSLLMYSSTPQLKTFPIKILDGKLYSEKILASLYGSQVYLTAFASDFKLINDTIMLKNISSEMLNGKMAGAMNYNLRDEQFSANFMGRSISASPLFNIITTRKDSVSGTADFDANVIGNLSTKQSLNGNIKFIVHNGRMSTLGKLEHLLYAQNIVADNMLRTSLSVVLKAITLKDTGLFKILRGDIHLSDGIAHINMLQSQGPLMALYIKGTYNPSNDYAKLIVLGRVSDEIVSGLGAFADFSINKLMIMLTGEDKKQNISIEDFDKIPQLSVKNTKEFKSVINGEIDKSSSVSSFNWVSYSQKSLRQKDTPNSNIKVPTFVENLPY